MYEHLSSKAVIEIDGNALSTELEGLLEQVVVEDHLSLPDTFIIRFRDLFRHQSGASPGQSLLEAAGLKIGAKVTISGIQLGRDEPEPLIMGEVTSQEGAYEQRGAHVAVRGHDEYHRLHRGRKTEGYTQVTDANLIQQLAGEAGLTVGSVDDPGITRDYISRFNQTAAEFLAPIAKSHDRELRIVSNGMAQLTYQPHAEASEAPSPTGSPSDGPPDLRKLIHGENLLYFAPRITSPQYKQVEARGWDPINKVALKSPTEQVTGTNAELGNMSDDAAGLAGKFGSATFLQPGPHAVQGEVDAIAKALAAQIGSTYAEAEATILGMPVKAGEAVSVEGVSKEFVGKWTIASARHVFDSSGYRTHLVLSGPQDRSLYGLVTNATEKGLVGGADRINGVLVGLVMDVKDPDKRGRVKVAFPTLSDSFVSDWARVVHVGAGADRGQVVLPEVNDEVLVAFIHGDPQHPIVLGGLYNGKDKPDPELQGDEAVDGSSGEVKRRGFVSREKHRLVFSDDPNALYVELSTQDKREMLNLDFTNKALELSVTDDGNYLIRLDKKNTTIEITSDGKITIKGEGDVEIEAKGDLNAKAKNVNLEGQTNVSIKGAQVNIEGSGTLAAKAPQVAVEGSGMVEVKGGLVKLN